MAKILHRKRPASVPLHGKWVSACYVHEDVPVPRAKVAIAAAAIWALVADATALLA